MADVGPYLLNQMLQSTLSLRLQLAHGRGQLLLHLGGERSDRLGVLQRLLDVLLGASGVLLQGRGGGQVAIELLDSIVKLAQVILEGLDVLKSSDIGVRGIGERGEGDGGRKEGEEGDEDLELHFGWSMEFGLVCNRVCSSVLDEDEGRCWIMRLWKRIQDIYILRLHAADYARDLSMDPLKCTSTGYTSR